MRQTVDILLQVQKIKKTEFFVNLVSNNSFVYQILTLIANIIAFSYDRGVAWENIIWEGKSHNGDQNL